MGRHDRVHGRDHKAAVVHAYEVQGMTAEQIVTLAAAGNLKAPGKRDRLRPFKIAESTVKEYARLARRRERRAATNGGHDADDGPVPNDAVAVPAQKFAPQDDADPGPLLQALLVKPEDDRTGAALEQRRHELSMRWVRATVSQVRAEHPSWGQLEVCKAARGRPRRFEDEWRISGHDRVPHDASPDTIRQLHELLDREEAELEELEARYPCQAPQSPGLGADQPEAA